MSKSREQSNSPPNPQMRMKTQNQTSNATHIEMACKKAINREKTNTTLLVYKNEAP